MDASRQSMRTRKVVNYIAMNGDRSDDSEDDIVNCVNVKLARPAATVTKPSKMSKLKLGTRKAKLPKCGDTKLTKLKPILDDMEPIKLCTTSPCLRSNMEELELSIAEPKLTTHSIFSQETVITSSCECLSPHEFTDSSESDTYCSTVEVTSTKEDAKLNTKCDPAKLKTNEDRIIKRRNINENLAQLKKAKIHTEETKYQNTFSGYESSVFKHDVDVSSVPLQISGLPTCLLVGTDKTSPKTHVNACQQLVTSSFIAHEEVSIFQKNAVQLPVQTTNQLMKHDHSSEIECSPEAIHLNLIETSGESGSIFKSPTSAKLTPKLTTGAVKEGYTSKVKATKNIVTNLKLKRNSANLTESKVRSKNISASTVVDEEIAEASLSIINGGVNAELNTSRNETNPSNSAKILKSPCRQSRKVPVKWRPPGKAGGLSNPLGGGNSPAIGIRLGLSRNRRASKPLHPDVKVKI